MLSVSSVLVSLSIVLTDCFFILPFRNACADGFKEESSGREATGWG